MKSSVCSAVLAAVWLTGCASLQPAADAPPLQVPAAAAAVPAQWQAPLPQADAATAAALATTGLDAGWAGLQDPLLLELIAAAQASSPTLAVARSRVAAARAAQAAAGAAGQPQLGAQATAAHGREVLGQPVGSRVTLGLQAGWELDLFGGVAAEQRAAAARVQAAEDAWGAARAALAAETASALVELRACEAQLGPAQADAASRSETARLTALTEGAGFTAPADAALIRAGAAQARINALRQQAACDGLVKTLVDITALPEDTLRQRLAARSARIPQPAPLRVETLPAALLTQRPDIAQAEHTLLAAVHDISRSQARERPRVSLSGSIAAVGLRGGGASATGTTFVLGPLAVELPLLDGGARAAATAAARAAYDEAVAQYQMLVRRAVREVESSLVQWQSANARREDALAAAVDFERSLRATEERQRGGLASLLDLESARRNALAAQSALIDLQRERSSAWINLYRALGGGWQPGVVASAAAAPTADASRLAATAAAAVPTSQR